MGSFLSVKRVLSFGVSIWLAGACLFSCTSMAMGAGPEQEAQNVVAHESCHAKHSQARTSRQPTGVPSFMPGPRDTMKDCPLVVNATAVASKNSGHLPHPGRVAVSALPLIEKTNEQPRISHVVAYLPNRGPTHLRCCVFLI